jgi:O-antigen ligase
MRKSALPSRFDQATRLLWGLVLLTLPVTTFRYVPDFMGRTLVQPMAIYPVAILFVLLAIRFIRERRFPLPSNTRLLLAFLLFAVIVSLVGFTLAPLPLRNSTYDERVLRGWFSLIIGLLFFFTAFWMNRNEADLRYSLKWIYAGLFLTIAWSLIQAIAVNTSLIPRSLINQIQLSFSARPLLQRRISGFAYEPAWLADQIVIFYLPWLFAAILRRRPVFAYRWLEPLLFLLCITVLIFTYSRGGLLSAILCTIIVFILMGREPLSRAWTWFTAPFLIIRKAAKNSGSLLIRLTILLLLIASVFSAVSFLSRYEYFASIWDFGGDESPVEYLIDISAGPRLAYLVAGYQTFEDQPVTGVGLGASGLYLLQRYPEWSQTIPEVARQLSPDSDQIPNIKSFYVRLLAETGLPGFWLFVVFFVSFLAIVRRMAISKSNLLRFVAVAGLFAWLGIGLRNLTQDSFTIPIMWVILGTIVGLYPLHPKEFRLRIRNEKPKNRNLRISSIP